MTDINYHEDYEPELESLNLPVAVPSHLPVVNEPPGLNAFQRTMLGLVRFPLVPIAIIGWFLAAIADDERPDSMTVSWESASKELGDGMSLVGVVTVSAVLAPFFMALVPPYLLVREVWRSGARRKLRRFLFGDEIL
jgi:hypothetical protein